jgi:hypothetical protein
MFQPLAAPPSGVDEDAWDAACAAVRAYCGWHVAPSVTEDLTVNGSGSNFQNLPTLHLTALNTLTEDGTLLDPSGFEWSDNGQLWRGQPWTGHFRGIVANITHGYDTCPPEIVGVLREAADRGIEGSAASQVGQVSMGGVSGVPGAVAFIIDQRSYILDRYKLPPRP